MSKRKRLDTILMDRGWVTEAQVIDTLREQKRRGTPFGSTLVLLGFLSEALLVEALSEQHGTLPWDPEAVVPEAEALRAFPESWVREREFMPLAFDPKAGRLVVAAGDPSDSKLCEEIQQKVSARQLVVLAAPAVSLERLWAYYGKKASTDPKSTQKEVSGSRPSRISGRVPEKRSRDPVGQAAGLGLQFSFAADEPEQGEEKANFTGPRVLLWLSQVYVSKLLMALLEAEGCQVTVWDGTDDLQGDWEYLVYGDDNLASFPDALTVLKRRCPQIQLVLQPSWTSCLLRSPLSYQHMRDGYVNLVEYAHRWTGNQKLDGRFSRYALAIARVTPMTPFEVDTLVVSCEMANLFLADGGQSPDWNALGAELRSPYPVLDIYRGASVPFNKCGAKPGASTPGSPFAARIYHLVSSFLAKVGNRQLTTMEALSQVTDWLREKSQEEFDPVATEALLRVMREDVLDGCLPPGPAEAVLVADRPMEWGELSRHLQADGWRLVMADGATDARKLVERRCPDAVVWAASGAIDWIRWQKEKLPDIKSYLVLEDGNQALARTALETGFEDVWTGTWDSGVAAAKLRHGMSRPVQAVAPNTVQGSLEQLGFVDLVSTLATGGRNVAIELTHGDKRATVVLWRGEMKFAASTDLQGEDAIYDVMSWKDGSFVLQAVESEPSANVGLPNTAIFLEGCRRMDEMVASDV